MSQYNRIGFWRETDGWVDAPCRIKFRWGDDLPFSDFYRAECNIPTLAADSAASSKPHALRFCEVCGVEAIVECWNNYSSLDVNLLDVRVWLSRE